MGFLSVRRSLVRIYPVYEPRIAGVGRFPGPGGGPEEIAGKLPRILLSKHLARQRILALRLARALIAGPGSSQADRVALAPTPQVIGTMTEAVAATASRRLGRVLTV